jgi:hypothetical protein
MAKHKVYYKGEGGGFPQVRAVVSLWVCVCLWFVCAPKCSNYALTNLWFGLCRSVWIIELLVNLHNPIWELKHALLPLKCCELGSVPQLFFLPLFSPLDSQLNPSMNLGVRQGLLPKWPNSKIRLNLDCKVVSSCNQKDLGLNCDQFFVKQQKLHNISMWNNLHGDL